MTTNEAKPVSATEIMAKVKELAANQPRYASVGKLIERYEQTVLRAADTFADHVRDSDSVACSKEELQTFIKYFEECEGKTEKLVDCVISTLLLNFINTSDSSKAPLARLQGLPEKFASICATEDKVEHRRTHQLICESLAECREALDEFELDGSEWSWLTKASFSDVERDSVFRGAGEKAALQKAWTQSMAVLLAVEGLVRIFYKIGVIDCPDKESD
ncbi:hypothetical protein CC86DRAFT_22391 [Ophiobolus disseminans]|uniref:Uncharacterized protein n=1 Tax=Ophiobolus disseminans TaxID=1469910 RepID=A0A6A7A0R9_9PLEO|nr:hypothetical protein CC86DRAFT_22391 [Ophiobolus disseminans]